MKDTFRFLFRTAYPLVLICTLTVALITAVNAITAPQIQKNEQALFNDSVRALFNLSKDQDLLTETIPLSTVENPPEDTLAAYRVSQSGTFLGYCIEVKGRGAYGKDLRVLAAFDEVGTLCNLVCLSHSETPGKGDLILSESFYQQHYLGKNTNELSAAPLPTLSGSTKTSTALYNAVQVATAFYEALIEAKGGTL